MLALVAVMAGIVAGNAGAFILGGNSEPPVGCLKERHWMHSTIPAK